MKIINLTPHEINVRMENGEMLNIPVSGSIARVTETRVDVGVVGGIRVTRPVYGHAYGVPEPEEGTIYIVSALVLNSESVSSRTDVFAPGVAIRDESGKIIGCDGLSCAPGVRSIGG